MMKAAVVLFVIACSVSGCAVARNDFVRLNPSANSYPAKSASESIYLTTMGIDDPYEEIGFLHISEKARANGGYEILNEKMREQARRVGADAVIYVTYGTENAFSFVPFLISIPYDVQTAEGLAVKRKKK